MGFDIGHGEFVSIKWVLQQIYISIDKITLYVRISSTAPLLYFELSSFIAIILTISDVRVELQTLSKV